ncbi:MAG: sigma-54 factor interaction domain-containing protein, partial [Nitrospirae bacterium]|nr:sigma-54 factor interaction domain-containing protein [Nitrospirota bacterium]
MTYVAARNYFNLNHSNSLLEIIARLLNNMDQILLCSSLWAKGYTNYLRLQCLKPLVSDISEVILLSQFGLKVEPMMGNINLIRGNYEGFIGLFDHISGATCTEELSQLKIDTIIKEFKGYKIDEREDKLFISETISKKEVAIARKVYLKDEIISCFPEDEAGSEGFVVDPKEGKVRVLTPQIEEDPKHWKRENMAYEIISEGALRSGSLTYTLRQGQFFNAPYSRYRFKWESKKILKEPSEVTKAKSEIVPLLFKHLSELRESHKRLLQCTIENKALAQANEDLKTTLQREADFCGIIGKSLKMQRLFEQVRLIAQADSTILILGETGTGKELLAKAIHQLSYRKDQEFFAFNCAAITESLLESELFGYEKGAFTGALFRKMGIFETANGGTLFLDEVGEISSAMQAKLLRVLEEHEIQRVG